MVYILGGWQSDFGRNWTREGLDIAGAFSEALNHGLAETGLEPKDIETGHVGNFVGELFAGQGLLGGFFGLVHPDFDGLPTSRHEAACASGSVAILAATAEIEAGRYDLACVLGIEQMRNVPGKTAAEHLGAAAWTGYEFGDADYVWPRAFSDLAEEYDTPPRPEIRASDADRRDQLRQRQAQSQRADAQIRLHRQELHRRRRGQSDRRGAHPQDGLRAGHRRRHA